MNVISNDYPDGMQIEWILSNVCNYKCNYCHDDLNGGSSGQPDYQRSVDFFNMIHREINPNKKMLTISGGEPTLWPDLARFFNSLDDSYYTAITTNGSRTVRWWRDFITDCDRIHRVTISVHLEYAEIDHIMSVCETIHDKLDVMVLLMYDKKYSEKFNEFLERFKSSDLRISVMIKPILHRQENNKPKEYTEHDQQLIRDFRYAKNRGARLLVPSKIVIDGVSYPPNYANYMVSNGLNNFKGWKCSAGSKRLVIWHDGTVYPASCGTAKLYPMGNMNDLSKFNKLDQVICQSDYCGCLPDLRTPKSRT